MKKYACMLFLSGALALSVHAADSPAPPSGGSFQPSMSNYDLSGMNGEQKRRMTNSVKKNQKQLGHGMSGLENKPKHKKKRKSKKGKSAR